VGTGGVGSFLDEATEKDITDPGCKLKARSLRHLDQPKRPGKYPTAWSAVTLENSPAVARAGSEPAKPSMTLL
jgi:hypothetical protein